MFDILMYIGTKICIGVDVKLCICDKEFLSYMLICIKERKVALLESVRLCKMIGNVLLLLEYNNYVMINLRFIRKEVVIMTDRELLEQIANDTSYNKKEIQSLKNDIIKIQSLKNDIIKIQKSIDTIVDFFDNEIIEIKKKIS